MDWVDDVLHFWFDTLRPAQWWNAAPEVDAAIRVRFASLLDTMRDRPPAAGDLSARGHLAAVIVFDQFPRHLHRGSPRAFASDALALALTLDAIDRGLDTSLTPAGRQFLYMPLMHSEDADLQDLSVAMFGRLGDRRALRSATTHRDTVERFGRFPYRNEALGRQSTADERNFLDENAQHW